MTITSSRQVGVDDFEDRKRITKEHLAKFFDSEDKRDFESEGGKVHGVTAGVARNSLAKVGNKADLVHIFSMAREDRTQARRGPAECVRTRKESHRPLAARPTPRPASSSLLRSRPALVATTRHLLAWVLRSATTPANPFACA